MIKLGKIQNIFLLSLYVYRVNQLMVEVSTRTWYQIPISNGKNILSFKICNTRKGNSLFIMETSEADSA